MSLEKRPSSLRVRDTGAGCCVQVGRSKDAFYCVGAHTSDAAAARFYEQEAARLTALAAWLRAGNTVRKGSSS